MTKRLLQPRGALGLIIPSFEERRCCCSSTAEVSTSSVVESLWNRTSRSAAVPYPKHGCRTASDTLPSSKARLLYVSVDFFSSFGKYTRIHIIHIDVSFVQSFHLAHKSQKYCLSIIGTRMPKIFLFILDLVW